MHFLEDLGIASWKNALNQYTLVTGPEQGAFYQSLLSVTILNIKNRVGCMDISVWLGGFQRSLGREQENLSSFSQGEACAAMELPQVFALFHK